MKSRTARCGVFLWHGCPRDFLIDLTRFPGVKTLFALLASNDYISVYGKPQSALSAAPGANASPRTNPATNPQRCAAMLTCGVERSNAVCIATIIRTLPNRCFACGA